MVRQSLADPRTAWRGTVAGLIVAVVLVAVFLSKVLLGPFTALQDRLFPAPNPDRAITLVAINEGSEEKFFTPTARGWPISNGFHAQVIRNLASHSPKVLILDIVLDHKTGLRCESEALSSQISDTLELEKACKAAGQLTDTDDQLVQALMETRAKGIPVIITCTVDDKPIDAFSAAAGMVRDRGLGLPDAANAIRTVPLKPASSCDRNSTGESAFVQVVRTVTGKIGPLEIPVEPDGSMLINFTADRYPLAKPCTYLLAFTDPSSCPDSLIRGKIVIVGVKVINADDIHTQAVGFKVDPKLNDNQNFGYRILGDEISTVLDRRFLRVEPDLSIAFIIFAISVLVGTVAYLLPFRIGALVTGIAIGAYVLLAVELGQAGYLIDPLFGPLTIAGSAGAALSARFLLEERERRKLEAIFGQYVDPSVMSELIALDSADELRVGGMRRELTVLFVDVRDFTTASETMPAEEVVRVLNRFTERCTRIVFEHGGTVDKYIGDCVMAFWNAPRPSANHADLAVEAALHMVDPEGDEGPLSRIGIGIYTGEVVVGNVGGATRKQYTAIGDVVNTASRLCSAAPAGAILVGAETYTRLQVKPPAERLEPLHVKGKAQPVEVYSLRHEAAVTA